MAGSLQIFSPDQLSSIVAATLPAATDTARTHVIVGTVDQNGAQAVAGFTLQGGRWQLQAAARHEWSGENSVGAKALLSW